ASPTDTNDGSAMSFYTSSIGEDSIKSAYRCAYGTELTGSTTSYSRHVVSTVQTRSAGPDNGTGLNRHRRRLTLHPFHIHNHIHLRPVSISLSSSILSPITLPSKKSQWSYISRVTGKHSTSTESYLSMAVLTTYIYTSIRPKEPGDNATKVPNNS